MKVRNRILLLSSLLLLVSMGGIGNLIWQFPRIEQMHDPKAIFQVLILLGLFGSGLIFSVLELVRQEIMSPIIQLAAEVARLKGRKLDAHRLEPTGSKDIDLLTRAFNDLLDGLQKEEDLCRIFAEASPDMIYLLDREGRVLFGNMNAARQWNYQAEEIIGKRQEELFPLDIAERHKRVIQKVFETGLPEYVDVHERIGGRDCWIDARLIPVLNKDSRVTAVLGISRDITARKKAEEALRASEENYKTLFEGVVYGIIAADSETKKFVYVNQSICRMLGYSPEELLRLGVENIHPKDSLDKIKAAFEAQRRGEKMRVTLPCMRKDGTLFYANIFAGAIVLNRRKCNVGFFIDVTAHLRAEQKIREAEHKSIMLSKAIENAHHGCLIISEDYKVLFGNHYALAKLGLDAGECKRLDWFSLCADREQAENAMKTITITRRWAGEVMIIQKDGGQFPALISITAMKTESQKIGLDGYIALFQDISTQKELQNKLLTSEKLAVMGRLVADVAHEINNPLAIIIGGTQLMLSRLDEKQAAFKTQLETVLGNARRCKTILASLLNYGRTLGRKEEAIHLPSLIQEAINDVNYQYDMSSIETALNCKRADDMEITGNRSALLSVFINLIRNARQAMGEEGRLTIAIEKKDKKHLRIEIHDTGIGMSKEQKAKLFKPFASGWKEEEGSGLGLATSLGIVETHGGRITAESKGEGQGATFTLHLPYQSKKGSMEK